MVSRPLAVLIGRRRRRWWAPLLLSAAALSGCFEFELQGTVASGGGFSGRAKLLVPELLADDQALAAAVIGPHDSIAAAWRARGAQVVPLPNERYTYAVTAAALAALSLPWLHLDYRETAGSYAFTGTVAFPPAALARLERMLAERLQVIARLKAGARGDPEHFAGTLVENAHVRLDLRFPEPPTATDGSADGRRIVWTIPAADLRSGRSSALHAAGGVGVWARIRDAAIRWWR